MGTSPLPDGHKQQAIRFWLPHVIVRPLVSVNVLPSASEVTADAAVPFWPTDNRRLAVSIVEAVVVVVVVPPDVRLSLLVRRLPIGSKP